jgi:hypothetical protein
VKRILPTLSLALFFVTMPPLAYSDTIDVLIKGVDDGVKTNKQQDYKEAVMNAKLLAIERAGVEISSITRVTNFKLKYDMVESRANAVLLPGFQIMDIGYQTDGTYQVVLSGRVGIGKGPEDSKEKRKQAILREMETVKARLAVVNNSIREAELKRERRHQHGRRIYEQGKKTAPMGNPEAVMYDIQMYNSYRQEVEVLYRRETEGLAEERIQLERRLSELRVELAEYPSPEQDEPSKPSKTAYAVDNKRYILSAPIESGEHKTKLTMGTELEIIEDRGYWCYVRTPSGTIGWVKKEWISSRPQ